MAWYTRIFSALDGSRAKSRDLRNEYDLVVSGFASLQSAIAIKSTQSAGEQIIDMTAAARANRVLAFDSSGNITTISASGFGYRGNWATATAYAVGDVYRNPVSPYSVYITTTAHTSSSIAADLAASKVATLIDLSSVADVAAQVAAASASATAAAASAASAVSAPGTNGTSVTSVAVGTGSKSFTTQTGKSWVAGQTVSIADTSAPSTNAMYGSITSYNSGTGALVVNVEDIRGSGTLSAWTIGLIGPLATVSGATVRSTVLTGLSLAASTVVAATHTILEAIGFLQAQVTLRMLKAGDTMSGDLTMGNNDILGVKYISLTAVYDNGNSGAAKTIDFANGRDQKVTLNAATPALTLVFPAPGTYLLELIQDATGGRAPTYAGDAPASSGYIGSASMPAINTNANGRTLISYRWDGTTATGNVGRVGMA